MVFVEIIECFLFGCEPSVGSAILDFFGVFFIAEDHVILVICGLEDVTASSATHLLDACCRRARAVLKGGHISSTCASLSSRV